MSELLLQLPSKLGLRTSARRIAAESGCSAIVPNSVFAVLGAPAPVFPPCYGRLGASPVYPRRAP